MIELIVYFTGLIGGFFIGMKLLMAIHLEEKFKKNHIREIKVAFFVISLIVGHLLGDFLLTLTKLIINFVG